MNLQRSLQLKETFETEVRVEDSTRSGLCVTAGNKPLGFFFMLLYGPVM